MKSKYHDFLKSQLKYICFSNLKLHNFEKFEKHLLEAESIALKSLTERKDLVIQKADKAITVVITESTKYLEGIKSLLLDSSKFMQLPIDEDKWINHIINLESKLKDRLKLLKNEQKMSEEYLIVFAQLELRPAFCVVVLKYIKQSLTTLQNFDLFYQQ